MTQSQPAPSSRAVSRRWLGDVNACSRQHELFGRVFGDGEMPVTRDLMERAMAAGLNVIWAGIRLIDDGERREFIAFTRDQRLAALAQLLGTPPETVIGWRNRAMLEKGNWTTTGDHDARSRALACQDMWEDLAAEATVAAADAASLHALRAIGMAGLDEDTARREQAEYLLTLVTGVWK